MVHRTEKISTARDFFREGGGRSDVLPVGKTTRQGRENFVLTKTKLFLTTKKLESKNFSLPKFYEVEKSPLW
jgi:hypothetical protein